MILKQKLFTTGGFLFGWIFDNVLNQQECQYLINKSRPILNKSTTLGPQIDSYRTSSNCFLQYNTNSVVDDVANIVSDFIKIPVENFEGMQIVHYASGEHYKHHRDAFNTEDMPKQLNHGGQRTWTAFAYLNNVESGGETFFPKINQKIKPKMGRVAFWLNCVDGNVIHDSLHEAMPPVNCEKWGANIWVREERFR
tara:strand:+ start:196 stop:783 length:588 start_codon:yes stop_codon:yes gene_type:complete